MTTLHGTKEQNRLDLLILVLTPILLQFVLVPESGCPNAVLYGFVDVVVVPTSNYHSTAFDILIISLNFE